MMIITTKAVLKAAEGLYGGYKLGERLWFRSGVAAPQWCGCINSCTTVVWLHGKSR